MRGTPGYPYYLTLRWLGLLAGSGTCLAVLVRSWHALPWGDVLLLGLLGAAARFRPVSVRAPGGDGTTMYYPPGDSLFIAALLRDGPAAALAVSLIAALLTLPSQPKICFKRPFSFKGYLEDAELLFAIPALTWLTGWVYVAVGGQRLLTGADSGMLFQHPLAMVVPLLFGLFVSQDVIQRSFMSLWMATYNPALARSFFHCSLTLMVSSFAYIEGLCGALGLALWTQWGWNTLPFSLMITAATLLSARNYLERVEARREAESDPLTGLASWRGLEKFLKRQVATSQRKKRPFALLFLDVDGLKVVNDRLGHAAGDALLTLVGECCRAHTRKNDLGGRRGGDEFILVLNGLERGEAGAVLRRLRGSVAEALAGHAEFAGMAGASIGMAVYPQDAASPDGLIACADRQMYADKQARKAVRAV